MSTLFQQRLAALQAKVGATVTASSPAPEAPVAAPQPGAIVCATTVDDGAKAELRQLDLLSVYRRWFNPQTVRQGGGNEVNCSCFNTTFHQRGDKNPQFGINTEKQTYHCHACNISGDIIDLAANYYGLADGDHRVPHDRVHEAVKEAGEELLGMTFSYSTGGGWQRVPEFDPLLMSTPPAAVAAATSPANGAAPSGGFVIGTLDPVGPAQTYTNSLPSDLAALLPEPMEGPSTLPKSVLAAGIPLDWRKVVPQGTAMHRYLDIVTADDSPEEYHFWQILMLIGLICGKDVGLVDAEIVYGNLLVCVVGQTGVGKSRPERHIKRLIDASLPFNEKISASTGIRVISGAGSGEYMLKEFHHQIPDPQAKNAPKGVVVPDLVHPGVRGLVKWSELSEMIGKASAKGATVREKVMELYDAAGDISFGSVTAGKTVVRDPFGSVTTTTQPEAIRRLLSRDEVASGFLNRWVFASGVPKQPEERGTIIDVTPVAPDVQAVQRWATGMRMNHRGLIDLTADADAEFRRFIRHEIVPLKFTDPLYARGDLLFKKLCLLLAANSLEFTISLDTVERAKIVFAYVIRCQEFFGAALAHSEENDIEDAIIEKIAESVAKVGEGLPGWKIVQSLSKKYGSEEVKRGIRSLEQTNRIELLTPNRPGPGRKPKLYYIASE